MLIFKPTRWRIRRGFYFYFHLCCDDSLRLHASALRDRSAHLYLAVSHQIRLLVRWRESHLSMAPRNGLAAGPLVACLAALDFNLNTAEKGGKIAQEKSLRH